MILIDDPTDIAGCKLWVAADQLTSLADNDPVATWTDGSGQGNDAIQFSGGSQPTYKTSIVNSLPVLRFTTSKFMAFTSNPLAGATAGTAFVVTKVGSNSNVNFAPLNLFGTSSQNSHWPYLSNVYDAFGSSVRKGPFAPPSDLSSAFRVINIITADFDYRFYVDGVITISDPTNDTEWGTSPTICSASNDGPCDIAEIILYDTALTIGQRQAVEFYLWKKYGVGDPTLFPEHYRLWNIAKLAWTGGITRDMVGSWELNEASGTAADSFGSNTLTDNNTVTSGTGIVYPLARHFTAVNSECLSIADNTDLSVSSDFSLEFSVYFDTITENQVIISKGTRPEYVIYIESSKIKFLLLGNVSYMSVASDTITTGRWYHGVCSLKANEYISITVNGITTTTTVSDSPYDGTGDFTIGGRPGTVYHDGLIGPVRMWKRVLGSNERMDLYNQGRGLRYSSFSNAANRVLGTPATDVSSCQTALMANRMTLADGDPVSSATDFSGTSSHGTASGSARPTFKTNIANGLPVFRFDGSDDFFASTAAGPTASIYAVCKVSNNGMLLGLGADRYIWMKSASDFIEAYPGGVFPGVACTGQSSFHYYSFHCDGTNYTVYQNGNLLLTYSTISVFPAVNLIGKYTSGLFADMDLPELITYSTVNDSTDRLSRERYLSAKYAIGPSARTEDVYAAAVWVASARTADAAGGGLTAVDIVSQMIWNINQAILRNRILLWNERAAINKSDIILWNDNLVVNQNKTLLWNEHAAISKNRVILWNEQAAINKADTVLWNTNATASKTDVILWNELKAINNSEILLWNEKAAINKSDITLWNTKAAIAKLETLIWNERKVIDKTETLLWNVYKEISKAEILLWNEKAAISKAEALLWNERAATSKTDTILWNERGAVNANAEIIRWNTKAAVSANSETILWNSRAAVNQQKTILFDVLSSIALSTVDKDFNILWNSRSAILKQETVLWNERAVANKTNSIIWNERGSVNKADTVLWNDKFVINATGKQLLWNERSAANKTSTILFNELAAITKSDTALWNARLVVAKAESILFNDHTVVGSVVRTALWNLRSAVGPTASVLYNARALTTKSLAIIFNDLKVINKTKTVVYNVNLAIAIESDFIWSQLKAIGVQPTALWQTLINSISTYRVSLNIKREFGVLLGINRNINFGE